MSTFSDILSSYSSNNYTQILAVFQSLQQQNGYITHADIIQVSQYFNLASEEVYSLLSFYPQFRFKPKGKYHIEVCKQSVCRMHKNDEIVFFIQNIIGIEPGEISSDALFSFDFGLCTGICKPHIRINDDIFIFQSLDELKKILEQYIKLR
ncbi:MAG: NAD(P)H-dependent oxidoreductase subunit E [Bacteroidales bacterium]|nr:NAD(P)H-dependent oxidoreductase subunit E [Bacteroidales bacterium]